MMGSIEEILAATLLPKMRELLRSELREALAEAQPAQASAYLSVTKAAEVADVDPETIRRWMSKGLLPDHRAEPTSHPRVRRDELDKLLAAKPKEVPEDSAEAVAAAILKKGTR